MVLDQQSAEILYNRLHLDVTDEGTSKLLLRMTVRH